MERDREKWNERYRGDGLQMGAAPSRYLAERIAAVEKLLPGRRALDIACGEGRNALFLARRGFAVTAVDISEVGLAKGERRAAEEGLAVRFLRADLEQFVFPESWDLMVNINFLLRGLFPMGVAALSPGGVFLVETILSSPRLAGSHNPAYLLLPGELRELFLPLPGEILAYDEPESASVPVARLIFRKEQPLFPPDENL